MKVVTRVETFDGKLHSNQREATSHVERIYGELLSKLSHRLVQIDKYSAMGDFVDANLHLFAELSAIKADLSLHTDED